MDAYAHSAVIAWRAIPFRLTDEAALTTPVLGANLRPFSRAESNCRMARFIAQIVGVWLAVNGLAIVIMYRKAIMLYFFKKHTK